MGDLKMAADVTWLIGGWWTRWSAENQTKVMTTIITMAILILIIKYDDYVYDPSHSLILKVIPKFQHGCLKIVQNHNLGVMILDNFETAMLKFWDYFENYFG